MATTNLRFRIIGDDDASGAFLKVAAAARLTKTTFDDLGSSAFGLTKMVGGAGLVPVLAGAAGAATELGVALGAAAGAGTIFGLSVGTTLADMVKQQKAIETTRASLQILQKGTTEYSTALDKLHRQQAAFNRDFGPAATGFEKMSAAFGKFKDQTRAVSSGVLSKAFNLLAGVLPQLAPVANAAGKAVGGLIDELEGWTKGPGFKALLKWLKDSGPKDITRFGHAVGNAISGLGGILSNFVGPGDKAAKTLEGLTKRFAAWGHSKGVSDSVDKFLKYVSGNGDKISSVFSSLAQILPKLAVAVGQLGGANLSAISMFLNLLATMPQGVFNVVVEGLFGIVAASKALAIVTSVNALLTGLETALLATKDACLLTRAQLVLLWATEKVGAAVTKAMAAAQWLLNAALSANPIGLVVIALAALVAGLVIAYKKSETFRDIVNGAFHGVLTAASTVFGWIKDHWALLFGILGGPIGLAVVAIVKNFDKVIDAVKTVGRWATWLWNSAFQPSLQFIVRGIGLLISVWAKMLGALGKLPGFGWAKDAANALQDAADKANALADGIRKIPTHKSSTVVLNVIHNVVHTTGGHVPAFASGTNYAPGGMALVGEEGPELVTLPRGSRVRTAAQTRSALAADDDLGTITVRVVDKDGREIERELVKVKRSQGGRQLAFI